MLIVHKILIIEKKLRPENDETGPDDNSGAIKEVAKRTQQEG